MSTTKYPAANALSQLVHEAQAQSAQTKQQETNAAARAVFHAKIVQLLDPAQYVGEVYHITYDEATVKVHDTHRRTVGGVPNSAFLLATRLTPESGQSVEPTDEDACFLLLRVMDSASLPDDSDAIRTRADAAAEVSGSKKDHWDQGTGMDAYTSHQLGYAGLQCKVLGTFYFVQDTKAPGGLRFEMGTDVDNFYPNRGLKVFKPVGAQLASIVNFYKHGMITDPVLEPHANLEVAIGTVRYSSTDRRTMRQEPEAVFKIRPADMIAQKTAFFGMTRTGKSNTVKVIVQAIHNLRHPQPGVAPLKVGQIIFDPNGEYGNANDVQASLSKLGDADSMFVYSLGTHNEEGNRRSLRFDFTAESNLELGKGILDEVLAQSSSAKTNYVTGFQTVVLGPPPNPADGNEDEGEGWTAVYAWRRKVQIYRTILQRGNFSSGTKGPSTLKNQFPEPLRKALEATGFGTAALALATEAKPTWEDFSAALDDLFKFYTGDESSDVCKKFEDEYRKKHKGKAWLSDEVRSLLYFHHFPNGAAQLRRAAVFHQSGKKGDYAEEIYQHLAAGRLVIVDLALGNKQAAVTISERIATKIFGKNAEKFAEGAADLPNIIVYAEEAHRLLPPGNDEDLKNIWAAIAKEGAKFRIGLAYSTQEPSSIQKNIIKATYNFFISHLNNEEETREIGKYYDLADFRRSILRNQDRGFVRVKTLSNPFTVPVQIRKFTE